MKKFIYNNLKFFDLQLSLIQKKLLDISHLIIFKKEMRGNN